MKKITIYTITALLTLQLGACRRGKDEVEQKTPEQIRLEQATHIDTISLCMRVNPDTIEGRSKLDSLSADAWMLIDDSTGMVISAKNAYSRPYMA